MTTALAHTSRKRPDATRCHLGEKLADFGITQAALAAQADMAPNRVTAICGSYVVPSVVTSLLLCDALEALTGAAFDVGELWVLARERAARRPKPGRPKRKAAT